MGGSNNDKPRQNPLERPGYQSNAELARWAAENIHFRPLKQYGWHKSVEAKRAFSGLS